MPEKNFNITHSVISLTSAISVIVFVAGGAWCFRGYAGDTKQNREDINTMAAEFAKYTELYGESTFNTINRDIADNTEDITENAQDIKELRISLSDLTLKKRVVSFVEDEFFETPE